MGTEAAEKPENRARGVPVRDGVSVHVSVVCEIPQHTETSRRETALGSTDKEWTSTQTNGLSNGLLLGKTCGEPWNILQRCSITGMRNIYPAPTSAPRGMNA